MNWNLPLRQVKLPIKFYRSKSTNTSEYCLQTVKNYDYENFIASLLLKNSARSCAMAVRSFNVEVARVAEQVSQESIGLMRLKFWEDTIAKCYLKDINEVPQHPVAIEIFKVVTRLKLTKKFFENLISCRTKNVSIMSFSNLTEMEKYAEESVSNVYYLVLEGCGVKDVHADHAASHLGKAQGIVQQLRSTPMAKQINLIPLPQDILAKHRVSQEDILRGKSSEGLNECTFEVATRAHQHLTKAKNIIQKIPTNAIPALLPLVTVDIYLKRLQKVNYDVFHPSLKYRPYNWLPRLWWCNFRNKL